MIVELWKWRLVKYTVGRLSSRTVTDGMSMYCNKSVLRTSDYPLQVETPIRGPYTPSISPYMYLIYIGQTHAV